MLGPRLDPPRLKLAPFALERFSNGGHFSVYNGTTPRLNLDATSVTQSSPQLIEITLSRAVDGLVSVGDLITLRSHTTLAQFFGEDNEAGIGGARQDDIRFDLAIAGRDQFALSWPSRGRSSGFLTLGESRCPSAPRQ